MKKIIIIGLLTLFVLPIALAAQVCYSSVQNIPATCNAGSITTDSYNGCRTLSCNGKTILACDKGNAFEMYNQGGPSNTQICIGSTCMTNQGYLKSNNYPICVETAAPNPVCGNGIKEGSEQCDDGNQNNNDGCTNSCTISSSQQCYSKVNDMPLTCSSSITQDNKGGCRTVTCGGKQIMACDKNGFFEMYNQGGSTSVQLCLAGVCITSQGYVKSPTTPICTGTTTPPPTNQVCGNGAVESGEQCDDGNSNNGDGCSASCQTESSQSQCYSSVQNIPATCNAGSITTDSYNGCRTLSCNGKTILACDKGNNFEMYNQGGPSNTQICIGSTCMTNQGYLKSNNYPICTGTTQPPNPSTIPTPVWFSHTEQTGVNPAFFHLEVQETAGVGVTDWELWTGTQSERVWSETGATGVVGFHTHTPDGSFEGSFAGKTQLNYNTQYRARARFRSGSSTSSWSEWRVFTTAPQQTSLPGAPSWTATSGFKVEKFATNLDVPVHLVFAPQGMYNAYPQGQRPYMYVTELYGKVKVIYADGSQSTYASNLLNFDPLGSITGGGQMGTVGLYVDNNNGDLYVGTVYLDAQGKVKNKVLRFATTDDGRSYTSVTTIIDNLPSAPSHQIEQITKGPDGKIYVNLGEGDSQSNPQNDNIRAGKIIRMNTDGSNVETYAKGFRNPFGADWRPGFNQLFVTDNSPDSDDRLLYVQQGQNYGWCCDVSKNIAKLDVSPVDVEFNPGNSGFPSELTGKLYVAVGGPIYTAGPTQGKQIIEFTLNNDGSVASKRNFVTYTGSGYGTPIGLDFGPDGLYFTDIYGEPGFIGNGKTEGNIYRISQGTPSGGSSSGPFRAGISVAPWYPKLEGNTVSYLFDCTGIDGSGNYKYDFNYGNGNGQIGRTDSRSDYVQYPYSNQQYTIGCTVHDQNSGQQASASTTINPGGFIAE